VGLGRLWIAMLSALLTWFILATVDKIERRISAASRARTDDGQA
jgi:hypothetical protein